MSQTTNQGIIIPDSGDVNDVPASLSEMVTGGGSPTYSMENRLVQRFLSSVDRTARNPSPFEGELSYLSDTDTYEFYNGTAWAPLSKGYVSDATRVVNSASFTTTETLMDSLTFTAVAGLRYKLTWISNLRSGVAADTGRFMFRWVAGAGPLTAAGTLFFTDVVQFAVAGATGQQLLTGIKTVTGITAGTTTIGALAIRDTGTGSWTSVGSATQQNYLLLEIV